MGDDKRRDQPTRDDVAADEAAIREMRRLGIPTERQDKDLQRIAAERGKGKGGKR